MPGLITGRIIGVIGLSGVVYTQRQAARREDERWDRESDRLAEERERQRELWAREHRREAHLNFMAEQRRPDVNIQPFRRGWWGCVTVSAGEVG
jgi:hypothetical protein